MSVIMDETILKEEKIIENVSLIDESLDNSTDQKDQSLEQKIKSDDLDTKESIEVLDNNFILKESNDESIDSDEINVIETLDEKIDSEKEEEIISQDISDNNAFEEDTKEELSNTQEVEVLVSEEKSIDKEESLEKEINSETSNEDLDTDEIVEELENIEKDESLEESNIIEDSKEEISTSEETIKSDDENSIKISEEKEEIKESESKPKRQNKVVLKGIKDGLLIILPDDIPWNETINDLAEVLDRDKSFWIGASTSVEVGKHSLDDTQVKRLSEMLVKRYNLLLDGVYSEDEKTIESSQKNDLKTGDLYTSLAKSVQSSKKENEQIKQPVQTDSAEIVQNTVIGNAMYLKQTVRSGQSVRFDGHIIIYGNANPGSEIIASGDIIVLGTLRGLAHAGARGDETSQIVATNLKASQLRIASCIGMSDDDDKSKIYNEPEYACIVDGKIFIGALKSRK